MYLIIGAGISGLGAAKLLKKQGHSVKVSDANPIDQNLKKEFENIGVIVFDGGHSSEHLNEVDTVVQSPGLPENHFLVQEAKKLNLTLTTEIDLALLAYQGTMIGVTGTNGKSTMVERIGHLLKSAGFSCSVAGNIGKTPSSLIADGTIEPILVLELSSYQLAHSHNVTAEVGIFTSFSEDHLSIHGSMESYFKAKWSLFQSLKSNGLAILCTEAWEYSKNLGLEPPPTNYKILDGSKNDQQIAVLAAAHVTNESSDFFEPHLATFSGLPHRMEKIGEIGGQSIFNDSKSTNLESLLFALDQREKPCRLIIGGQSKGQNFSPVNDRKSKIQDLIVFGESAARLRQDVSAVPSRGFETLLSALDYCIENPVSCETIFSPGCASFDEFKNFEHRGKVFLEAYQPHFDR